MTHVAIYLVGGNVIFFEGTATKRVRLSNDDHDRYDFNVTDPGTTLVGLDQTMIAAVVQTVGGEDDFS